MNKIPCYVLIVLLQLCGGNDNQVEEETLCSDLIVSHNTLRMMNPSDCKLSHKNEQLTCIVRLMSESIPFNVTSIGETDFSSLVRVNLNYIFQFRVVQQGGEAGSGESSRQQQRCLVLTGVSFRRVSATDTESHRRHKVLLPSRLFHLAANSALLGADSEVDDKLPAGVITMSTECGADGDRGDSSTSVEAAWCVRAVGVALPEAAAQLDLALLAFNYSFSGSGFPDRSGRGKSVSRSLPTQRLQRLRLRGEQAGGGAPVGGGDIQPEDFPALGAEVTELDLSHTVGHNLTSWEPRTEGLQRVALSHSGLRAVPDFVRRQSSLRGLALDGNSALVRAGGATALRDALQGLTELQDLQLAGVRTDVFSSTTLPPLPSLTSLNMSGCGLRHVESDALAGLPALQRLDLSANLLSQVPASLPVPAPRLRHLTLARNKLVKGPRLRLRGLLHELDLSGNALQSVDDVVSEGRVVTLRMAHNIVRSVEGARFPAWAERVDLSHNLISSLGLRAARRDLEGLVALNLRGNRWDCSSCTILELQMWLNETSVLLTPEPQSMWCGEEPEGLQEEEEGEALRVMDVHLPDCTPELDYALLIAAPLAAALVLGAALLALVCVRRAGWLGVCVICCGQEDEV